MNELAVGGMSISKDVLDKIVRFAAEKVEGVAVVGRDQVAGSVLSLFASHAEDVSGIEAAVIDDKLNVKLGIAAFFGYPFDELADNVRFAVADAIAAQVGVDVAGVDIAIDSVVFPKA